MENLYIFKLGGSCLKNKEAMEQSLKIIEHYKGKGHIIAVTSAFYGVTNKLLDWIGYSSDLRTEQESQEVLNKIKNFHIDVVEGMIKSDDIRGEALKFIDERFSELKALIPIIVYEEPSTKILDRILSYGERLSTYIYSRYLEDQGYGSCFFSGDDKLMITNNHFGNALPVLEEVDKSIPNRLDPALKEGKMPIFSGYYGSTKKGEITTLGRGGTDFTATIIGYTFRKLYDVKVIFWKDVDGILSANPKYEPHAKLVKNISFKEAKELAFFGSKVLHPLCLITAEKGNSTVELRNYNGPFSEDFTKMSAEAIEEEAVIKAITALEDIAMVTIEGEAMVSLPGTAARIFGLLGEHGINIKFISQSSSENNITFGVSNADGFNVGQVLATSEYFGEHWLNIKVDHDVSLVAVVGAGMEHRKGIAGKLFSAIGDADVNIRAIAQGSSELNITFVINRNDLNKAVRKIYHTFILMNGKEE